jgi:hypothetical protein
VSLFRLDFNSAIALTQDQATLHALMNWADFPVLGAFLGGRARGTTIGGGVGGGCGRIHRLMGVDEEGTLGRLKAVKKDPV